MKNFNGFMSSLEEDNNVVRVAATEEQSRMLQAVHNAIPDRLIEPINLIVDYEIGKTLALNGFDMSRVTVVGGFYNKKTKQVEQRWFNNIDWRTISKRKTENLIKRIRK